MYKKKNGRYFKVNSIVLDADLFEKTFRKKGDYVLEYEDFPDSQIRPDLSGETEKCLKELATLEQSLKKLRPDAPSTTIREAALVLLGRAKAVEIEAAHPQEVSVSAYSLPSTTKSKGMSIAAEQIDTANIAEKATASLPSLAWPKEQWLDSKEKAFRKHHAIVRFLERVWNPFIKATGTAVTREILQWKDLEAEKALTIYLDRHPWPKELLILYPEQLKELCGERPILVRTDLFLRMPDM